MSKSLGYFFRRFQSPSRHFYFFISSTFPIFFYLPFFFTLLISLPFLAGFVCMYFKNDLFSIFFCCLSFYQFLYHHFFLSPSQIFILKLPFPRSGDNKESSRERKEGGKEGRKEGGRESRPKTKTFGTRNGRLERFLPPLKMYYKVK